jgi:hypothetical protein
MSQDWGTFFDDLGGDTAVAFPGARPPKQVSQQEERQTESPTDWDTHPREYIVTVNGRDVATQVFPIRALARALDRGVTTIRAWETKQWLPKALVRAPRIDGVKGHRLYSRAFIEGVQKIAEEEGVMNRYADVSKTKFPQRAFALMRELGL